MSNFSFFSKISPFWPKFGVKIGGLGTKNKNLKQMSPNILPCGCSNHWAAGCRIYFRVLLTYDFLCLPKKIFLKIYRLQVWIVCKMHHQIPLFLALRLSVRRFEMPLEGLGFVKTLATLELFTQRAHLYKMWLRSFASVESSSIFLIINAHSRPRLITWTNFSKSG